MIVPLHHSTITVIGIQFKLLVIAIIIIYNTVFQDIGIQNHYVQCNTAQATGDHFQSAPVYDPRKQMQSAQRTQQSSGKINHAIGERLGKKTRLLFRFFALKIAEKAFL